MNADDALRRWNERFAAPGYLFGTAPNAFLASQRARFAPGMAVLAVADGEGRNGVWLAGLGCRVTAVDFSPVALAKARGAVLQVGDVELPLDAGGVDWIDTGHFEWLTMLAHPETASRTGRKIHERNARFDFIIELLPGGTPGVTVGESDPERDAAAAGRTSRDGSETRSAALQQAPRENRAFLPETVSPSGERVGRRAGAGQAARTTCDPILT